MWTKISEVYAETILIYKRFIERNTGEEENEEGLEGD